MMAMMGRSGGDSAAAAAGGGGAGGGGGGAGSAGSGGSVSSGGGMAGEVEHMLAIVKCDLRAALCPPHSPLAIGRLHQTLIQV